MDYTKISGRYQISTFTFNRANIINIFSYFNQFCLEKLQNEYPEHGFYDMLSAKNPEGLIEQLKESLDKIKKQTSQQLNDYNFGLETGMPISYLSGKNIDSYAEMIISLLKFPKQHLYTGEASIHTGKKYVLSLSSIIMLANLNLLDTIACIKEKLVISSETLKSIEQGVKESQKHAKITSGNVVLGEDGKIISYSFTEEDKKNRKKYWTKILIAIKQIKVVNVEVDDLPLFDLLEKHLIDDDIQNIEVSKKLNFVLVSDDLFIRKIHHGITNSKNTTNSMGLILSENLLTLEELIIKINQLVKSKYLYPLTSDLLFKFYAWIISIEDDDTRIIYFNKLKEIYSNILNEDSYMHYIQIHKEFVDSALKSGLPSVGIYKLVEEPFKLKPFEQFMEDKKKEIFKGLFYLE